jgi:hypothetical protein
MKFIRGFEVGRIMEVFTAVLTNQTYAGYKRSRALSGHKYMALKTYYQICDIIFKAVKIIAEKYMAVTVEAIKNRGDLVVSVDMGWAHRGWVASQGWYPVVDYHTQKIIHLIVMMKQRTRRSVVVFIGNYFGISGGMESRSIRVLLDWLELNGLLFLPAQPSLPISQSPQSVSVASSSAHSSPLEHKATDPFPPPPGPPPAGPPPPGPLMQTRRGRMVKKPARFVVESSSDDQDESADDDDENDTDKFEFFDSDEDDGSETQIQKQLVGSECKVDVDATKTCECIGACICHIEVHVSESDMVDIGAGEHGICTEPATGPVITRSPRKRLLRAVVMDKDTKNSTFLRNDSRSNEVAIYLDPGHICANLKKQCVKSCTQARGYKGLPARIGKRFISLIGEAKRKYTDSTNNKNTDIATMRAHFYHNGCM